MSSPNLPLRPGRRRIRLERPQYQQLGAICSVTIVVKDRQPIFGSLDVAEAAATLLQEHADARGIAVYAYCVMPDHMHLLLGASPTCDIVTFVGEFKSLVLRAAWQQGVLGRFWQRSFWDHFLRDDEDVEQVVTYILNNPVRAKMVDEWQQYPFAGSLVWEL
jgi:REP element-mobilizing transposase RayT